MKAKTIIVAFTLFLTATIFPTRSFAQEASGSSATLHSLLVSQQADNRAQVLRAYLQKQDSPLADYAEVFVNQADLYGIDWRFVAAIAGRESTFAKAEPCINPFGYGIYGTTTTCFTTYPDAITTVTKALRQTYINKWGAEDVTSIGKLYAASPTWASGVLYFMDDIQKFAINTQPLPISL